MNCVKELLCVYTLFIYQEYKHGRLFQWLVECSADYSLCSSYSFSALFSKKTDHEIPLGFGRWEANEKMGKRQRLGYYSFGAPATPPDSAGMCPCRLPSGLRVTRTSVRRYSLSTPAGTQSCFLHLAHAFVNSTLIKFSPVKLIWVDSISHVNSDIDTNSNWHFYFIST